VALIARVRAEGRRNALIFVSGPEIPHHSPGGSVIPVSYQCHMNCDEWRQKVNKDRKEKVNLTTPI